MGLPPLRQNNSLSPFIVVEGPSGVGKSTAAQMLAAAIGGAYMHGPPDEMDKLRTLVNNPADPLRPIFYAIGNALCSRRAEILLADAPVVLDRYVFTTLAWHTALGFKLRFPWGDLDLLRPDYAFLLTVNEESDRLRRLSLRSKAAVSPSATAPQTDEGSSPEYVSILRSFGLIEIETTNLEPRQVVREMLQHVRKRVPLQNLD